MKITQLTVLKTSAHKVGKSYILVQIIGTRLRYFMIKWYSKSTGKSTLITEKEILEVSFFKDGFYTVSIQISNCL